MTKKKLEQLIEKREKTLEKYKQYSQAPADEVSEFIKDLKSLQEPTENRWRCSKCWATYFESKKGCEYICWDCIGRVSIFN